VFTVDRAPVPEQALLALVSRSAADVRDRLSRGAALLGY
jgi:hypothetical protein